MLILQANGGAQAPSAPPLNPPLLTHGFLNKFTYLFRTTPNISSFAARLEDCLRLKLIPALTGQNGINDDFREILSLPARLGGMGITNPQLECEVQFKDLCLVMAPLVNDIILKSNNSISFILDSILENKKNKK